jgi:tRNA uridine 5-carboxymethylaminomethyl modification enzyme
MNKFFDVIVIGGGHAGCEAACASARVGVKTLLITAKEENLGEMSCNPAIGGVAKGTIVREIDALDGIMGKAIDESGIHFRILNSSKGEAVHSPRAQADRQLYRQAISKIIKSQENLEVFYGLVTDFEIKNNRIVGVYIGEEKISANAVVLTTGTFLGGMIHIGNKKIPAGRVGENPANELSQILKNYNFFLGRLKTGTPPRVHKDSINYKALEKQEGDCPPVPFSYLNEKITVPQISCFITHTNKKTHQIIEDNLQKSAMHGGEISGKGPRYCPSIEDKIHRFCEKNSHQIFLEPEGLNSNLIYPNGISTSLPEEVQIDFVRSIRGLENAQITTAGYAIEYDYVDARELEKTLETKKIKNLFFAGQINGTTGYEEAAGQGLVAGVNAALKSKENEEFTLDRSTSYIGVMIDDLTNLGTDEPYRMFTSRAEYRLSLRADNADLRLTEIGIKFGFVKNKRKDIFLAKKQSLEKDLELTKALIASPYELEKRQVKIRQDGIKRSAFELLSFPKISFDDLFPVFPKLKEIPTKNQKQIAIEARYFSYLKRQQQDIEIFKRDEKITIPNWLKFSDIKSLSAEVIEKLQKVAPKTIGSASRISGITPASIMAIIVHIKKRS